MLSQIKNTENEMAERQLIAFFLIDPLNPIKSAKDFPNVQCTDFEKAKEKRKCFKEKRAKAIYQTLEENKQSLILQEAYQVNLNNNSVSEEERRSRRNTGRNDNQFRVRLYD